MSLTLFLLLCTAFVSAQGITTKRNYIRVDQFGYLPNAKKVAVIADAVNGFNSAYGINLDASKNVQLRRVSDNVVVRQGTPTVWNGGNTDGYSGDKGWWWDFSSYTTSGEYYIRVTEVGGNTVNSNRFRINANVYDVVLKKAMNMFYYQRCDTDKNGNFASGNKWTDGKWYTQDANTKNLYNAGQTKDMRGGWIDAGDPNKYITFAAPVVHNLLTSYETHPDLWNNFNLDLPESGNSAPDILDEVKFEMDWIRRMQASNGGVHIKMGILDDSGYRNPPSGDNRDRWYEEVCPSSSVVAAGMMAHAAAAFRQAGVFSSYADDLVSRAERAWTYYANSGDKAKDCDEGRIEAGDADGDYGREHLAEASVAAVYLYQVTGKATYNNFFKNNYQQCRPYAVGTGASEWAEYRAHQGEALLNYTKLGNADNGVKTNILNLKKSSAKSSGPYYSVQTNQNLYRARAYYLNWGSNSLMSRNGSDNMDFINYDLNSGNHAKHRERAQAIVNYIHGVNPFGMTYLSNMYGEGGDLCADEMWHTWFTDGSDYDGTHSGRTGPPPGFLSGGAMNQGQYLPMRIGNNNFNTGTTNQPAQKSWSAENGYAPDRAPWAFNEPAIYYQASYVKMLADVIADGGGGTTTPPPPTFTNAIRNLNGPGTFSPGGNYRVTFDYEAASNLDIVVLLQYNGTPNYSAVAPVIRRQVSAGTGSFTLDLKPRENTPVRNNGYQATVYLTDRGGNWSGRKDFKQIRNLDCVAAPSLSNSLSGLSAANSFTPGGNLRATINYESAGNHDVVAVLQYDGDPNYSWVAPSIRRQVSPGSGTLTFDLKPRANTPVRNDAYQVNIFLTKRGKGWSDRFTFKTKKDIDCVAAAPSTSNDWVYTDNFRTDWSDYSYNGSVTVRDGGIKRVGSYSFKFISSGGAASMGHVTGKDASAANLKEVGFFVRSWDSNYTSQFQARWNDNDGSRSTGVSVTPNWKYVKISKNDLGTDWIKRMVWTVPNGRTMFLDNVRLVYYTTARGTMTQHVGDRLDPNLGADLVEDPTLNIYPNPNQGVFTVEMELPTDQGNLSLRLMDLNGRIADQISVNAVAGHNRLQMDYRDSQLPRGIYLLQVASADGGVQLMRRVSIQ